MSSTERTASIATVSLRQMERPNSIQEAMADYDRMSVDLAQTKASLAEYIDIANKVQAENDAIKRQAEVQREFFTRQVDLLTNQRDRLQSVLKGITTRYRIIRDCFAQCEADALSEGVTMTETPKPDAQTLEVPTPRIRLAPNAL